jgi:hypothetical protein
LSSTGSRPGHRHAGGWNLARVPYVVFSWPRTLRSVRRLPALSPVPALRSSKLVPGSRTGRPDGPAT